MKVKAGILIILGFMLMCSVASAVTEINNSTTFPYNMSSAGETYVLTENISTSAGALVVGANNVTLDGQNHSITFANSKTGNGISVSGGKRDTIIKNVKLFQTNTSVGTSYGVYISTGLNFTLDNIQTDVYKGAGIYVKSGAANTLISNSSLYSYTQGLTSDTATNITIVNSVLHTNATNAIRLSGTTHSTIQNCTMVGVDICTYILTSSDNNTFINCTMSAEVSDGIRITSSNANTFLWCKVETVNTNDAVYLTDGSTLNVFRNCSANTTTGYGINLSSSSGNIISDCYVRNTYDMPVMIFNSTNTFSNMTIDSPRASAPYSQKHILTVGDSITKGIAGAFGQGYAVQANATLNTYSPTWHISNVGIGGTTAEQGRVTFPQWLDIYCPQYVCIMYGQNDLGNRVEQDIINDVLWMAQEAKNRSITPYILLTPSVVNNNALRIAYNTNLSIQAEALGYDVINFYDAIDSTPQNGIQDAHNATNYEDLVHPNLVGYSYAGPYVARNILALSYPRAGTGLSQTFGFNGEVLSNSRDIYSTDTIIPFAVIPTGDWVRVNITTWTTNSKVWTEDMDSPDGTTTHTIGDFPANTDIDIYRDGIDYDTVQSNSTGYITWVYDGGFSEHTFEAIPHATAGARDSFASSWDNTVSMVGAIVVTALAGSMIAVFRGKRNITDVVNDLPGIILVVVLLIVGAIIFGQF